MGAGARAVLRPRQNCSSRGIATQARKKNVFFFTAPQRIAQAKAPKNKAKAIAINVYKKHLIG
jgi:hypothetical protein